MVDAQTLVLAEGQVAVVPPAPGLGRLVEQPEGVNHAQPHQPLKVLALLRRAVDLAGPQDGVVHVGIGGGDVEVAHQDQVRVRDQLLLEPLVEGLQPAHLVDELVAVGRLAVGEVAAHHADRSQGGMGHGADDHTGLLIVEAGDVLEHRGAVHAVPGQQGDAVVGFLAEAVGLVAGGGQLRQWELVVGLLGFLQHDDLHRAGGQPVQQLRQAHGQGVDVPGGEFHGVGRLFCAWVGLHYPVTKAPHELGWCRTF